MTDASRDGRPGLADAVRVAERLAERLAGRAASYDTDAAFPTDDLDDLRASGLLGLLVPVRLGGMGGGFLDYVRVAQALARGAPATALIYNMHASVTGALATVPEDIARSLGASERFFAHRDEVLAAAVAGGCYGVAITEREAGSRLSKMATTFEPDGDGYRLRGHKTVCSGAGHLDGYLVAARATSAAQPTPPGVALAPGAGSEDDGVAPRVSHFLVPAGDGLVVDDTWDPLGMRATASNGFALDVRVPASALLGGIEGLAVLLAYVLPQWLVASYAAVYAGLARAVVDEAVAYVNGRVVAGEKGGLGGVGFVRARLGRADAQAEAARLAVEEAGRRVDTAPGEPETNRWVYRAKLLAGDAAMEAAASCTEACGLGATRRGQALERLFRDARYGALMPPSSDVCADVLGTAALGRDPIHGTDVRPW
jgi:alkylation response protein AidB-like acyl-CoA dehydrogenase